MIRDRIAAFKAEGQALLAEAHGVRADVNTSLGRLEKTVNTIIYAAIAAFSVIILELGLIALAIFLL